jgi:two-component system, OmpR family, response regulator MprA
MWTRAKPRLTVLGEGVRDERLIAALQLDFDLYLAPSLAETQARTNHDPHAEAMLLLASSQTYRRSLAELRERTDAPLVLILRAGHAAERVAALESGADDVLAAPYDLAELIARLRAVMRRTSRPLPTRLRVDDLEIDLDRHSVHRGERMIRLSPTEFAMVVVLARSAGCVVPAERLTEEVWGSAEGASPATLHTFMSGLRSKIEEPGRTRLLETVRGVGYLLVSSEERV